MQQQGTEIYLPVLPAMLNQSTLNAAVVEEPQTQSPFSSRAREDEAHRSSRRQMTQALVESPSRRSQRSRYIDFPFPSFWLIKKTNEWK